MPGLRGRSRGAKRRAVQKVGREVNANLPPTKYLKRGERGRIFRILWKLPDEEFAIVADIASVFSEFHETPGKVEVAKKAANVALGFLEYLKRQIDEEEKGRKDD